MFCGTKETHFKVNKLQWKKMIGYFVKPTDLIGYLAKAALSWMTFTAKATRRRIDCVTRIFPQLNLDHNSASS